MQRHQQIQSALGVFALQLAHLAAADELEHLRDEFDLTYAACTEFDVVLHAFFADFLANLAVQRAHAFIRIKIQILAVDKRAHQAGDVVVTRADDAAFNPRIALPFAALGNQITLQCGFAQYQSACVAIGAQTHVYAEHLPFIGDVAHQ